MSQLKKTKFMLSLWIFILTLGIWFSSCAPFSNRPDKNGVGQGENAFRPVAVALTNEPAVPVEIANDIKLITEGKTPTSNSWQSVPPPEISQKSSELDSKVSQPLATEVKLATPPLDEKVSTLQSTGDSNGNRSPSHVVQNKTCPKGKKTCVESYRVRIGDTLMKISFEKYGSLFRWREIYERNRDQIKNYNILRVGMTLTIEGVEYIVIERNGEPYLIKKADTLAKISNKVYGTPSKWKVLWKNNPQLIKNPNKIYAGLTLYYQPISGKENLPVKK